MSDFDMNEFNQGIIEEFRANAGVVTNPMFDGMSLILLHHRGAKTGTERVAPLGYQDLDDGRRAVFATAGGAPNNPAWFHNLVANPIQASRSGPTPSTSRPRWPIRRHASRSGNARRNTFRSWPTMRQPPIARSR